MTRLSGMRCSSVKRGVDILAGWMEKRAPSVFYSRWGLSGPAHAKRTRARGDVTALHRLGRHEGHGGDRHVPSDSELGLDGLGLAGETSGVQVEQDIQADIPPVRALVARVAPAVDGQAGLSRAVRVGGTGELGEASTVGVGRADRAGLG